MNKEEFLRRMADPGQREAVMRDLYLAHFRTFVRRCTRYQLREVDAQEITLDALVNAWKHWEQLAKKDYELEKWLNIILKNKRIDFLKSANRNADLQFVSIEDSEDGSTGTEVPKHVEEDRIWCRTEALDRFCKEKPKQCDLLKRYADQVITADDLVDLLPCASPGAAREQIRSWRQRLREICLSICEPHECGCKPSSAAGSRA